jgi:CCR4-NOT transcription complex subunit 7/8
MHPPARGNPFGGPQGISPFQAVHAPQSHAQQTHQNSVLPPPSLGTHPGFGAGTQNINLNPFGSHNATGGLTGLGAGGGPSAGAGYNMGFGGAHIMDEGMMGNGGRGGNKGRIRDVWKSNLSQEMSMLRSLISRYPYIAMVSFPLE